VDDLLDDLPEVDDLLDDLPEVDDLLDDLPEVDDTKYSCSISSIMFVILFLIVSNQGLPYKVNLSGLRFNFTLSFVLTKCDFLLINSSDISVIFLC